MHNTSKLFLMFASMRITDNANTFPFGDLPFEIRMRILKYATITKLDVLNMFQSPYRDEYKLNIKKNNVCEFLDVIKNTDIRVFIFTGKNYNDTHDVIQSKMKDMTIERLGELIDEWKDHKSSYYNAEGCYYGLQLGKKLVCGIEVHDHVLSKIFIKHISLHNMAQYKNVLKIVDYSTRHVTFYRKKLLLISVGYPTKKTNTPTYEAYNNMVETLKKQYNVKVVYLNLI